MLLAAKPNLFIIGTIIFPKPKILMIVVANAKIDTNAITGIDAKIGTDAKTGTNARIDIDTRTSTNMKINTDKLIFDFPHTLGKILVDTIMLTRIKVQNMKMAK